MSLRTDILPSAEPGMVERPMLRSEPGPDPACLRCGGALRSTLAGVQDDRFGVPGRFDIVRCRDCGLEQTAPRPSPEALQGLYERYYNFGGSRDSAYARLRERLFRSRLYTLWLAVDGDVSFHARRGTGRLLDFGCNEGRGLARYRAMGFQAEGMELNRTAAAQARARGFTVHERELSGFTPEAAYDVVVLSNVLEHVADPDALLREIHRILAPGGQIWISCPNAASWLRDLFGRSWVNWHVPFHLSHFSAATLSRGLVEGGFQVRSVGQQTPALWVAQSLISRWFARPGRPNRQLRNPSLVAPLTLLVRLALFPLLWAGNRTGRGDCLVVVARKT